MVSGTEWSDNNGTFTAATTTTTMSQQRIVTTGDGDNSDCSTNSTSTGLFTFVRAVRHFTTHSVSQHRQTVIWREHQQFPRVRGATQVRKEGRKEETIGAEKETVCSEHK